MFGQVQDYLDLWKSHQDREQPTVSSAADLHELLLQALGGGAAPQEESILPGVCCNADLKSECQTHLLRSV
jgi:hypothetical protein